MFMFVYLIVNDVNLKIYVGKTTRPNLQQYLQQKFYEAGKHLGGNSHLYAAIRKHGRGHFHIHSLISDCKTNEELSRWEQTLIKALAAQNPEIGYNICRGGEGFTGRHSEKTRQKIATAARKMWKRPGIKENFSAKMTGHSVSPETIEKMIEAKRGKPGRVWSEKSKRKVAAYISANRTGANNPNFGKKQSTGTIAKRRATMVQKRLEKDKS